MQSNFAAVVSFRAGEADSLPGFLTPAQY